MYSASVLPIEVQQKKERERRKERKRAKERKRERDREEKERERREIRETFLLIGLYNTRYFCIIPLTAIISTYDDHP